jgi:hypothetical protein
MDAEALYWKLTGKKMIRDIPLIIAFSPVITVIMIKVTL